MHLECTVGAFHGLVLHDMFNYRLPPMGQGPLHPVSTWALTAEVLADQDHLSKALEIRLLALLVPA